MAYFKDLREYIEVLEQKELLWRIQTPVKKETELMPIVRWQYRGLPEAQRRAFLFENVTDGKGRKYDIPVLVGALAGTTEIYATGLMCKPEEIGQRWEQAQRNPIPPKLVTDGPVHEEIHTGKELVKTGLDMFPFTIDTPGFDGLRRTTATHFISKDPETGSVNIGNYSGQVQARDRMTIGFNPAQHMAMQLEKAKNLGRPLQAALAVGVVPAVGVVSVAKVAYGQNELAVAGGLAGEALEVVKCKTVDLEVPAAAEIVIEGEVPIDYSEGMTGSFGEYCGYMAETHLSPVFNITCITHRKNPIFTSIISQMPPSESSKIRQIAFNANVLNFLKNECNIPNVMDVVFYESSGSWQFCVIQLRKTHNSQAWQALYAAASFASSIGKFIVAVDEDIDPHDPDSVIWAMSFRTQPQRDTRVLTGRLATLDPSSAPSGSPREERVFPKPTGSSAMIIDATRKWDYPPVALPKQEYMERAREIWEAEGLPSLKPRKPWHGYTLGYWPEEYAEAAQLNLEGRVYELGERKRQERGPFGIR
jgi:4-hydroxy-3-polyprenylbenzoate decarboxylase